MTALAWLLLASIPAAWAMTAAYNAAATDLVALLTGLIDEYDRLTGRDKHRGITADQWADLIRKGPWIHASCASGGDDE